MKRYLCIFIVLMITGSTYAQVDLCIDAGHGGIDPGAKVCTHFDSSYWEKDLNLEVTLLLKDSIPPTTSVYFTRLIDTFLYLDRRAWLADSVEAGAFISIHFNSVPNPESQYILTIYSNSDTVWDGGMYEGQSRSTDSLLAAKIGFRIHDHLGGQYKLNEFNPWDVDETILRLSKMTSTLLEPLFISDSSAADSLYENKGKIRNKIVSAIYQGWKSWTTGQGIALVDYEYSGKGPHDYIGEVEIAIGGWDYPDTFSVPYQGCWQENEFIELNAIEFIKSDGGIEWPYNFHHWEWRDWNPDTVIATSMSQDYSFFVIPSYTDSTHYWVAYFTGGPFDVSLILPPSTVTEFRPNDTVELIWNAPGGARHTCSLYVSYSINNGQSWNQIIGPIPYDFSPLKKKNGLDIMTSVYNWVTPNITAENCYLRFIAYDAADNKDTLISHKFSLNCCIGLRGNADCSDDEEPDISDVNRITDFLYLSHDPLCCFEEADTYPDGMIDISDISRLIDYLYLTHKPLPNCP
ncbi:MAG: N-acetylmuramoyl-L-alanine amidase [candidate division Zixibacteria bacterium]|nr:N-acetylmuramoyl-L-alanine amidase [candidate division Zixibacteria bacterium]MDD5425726.1 N-acetylmuramoyl-L-alanine amidase [candidate division Zixibacteria bacterium]